MTDQAQQHDQAAAEAAVSLPAEDRPTLVRTFEAIELTADGRNLEILCVPYNTPALVADPPDFQPYREEFLHGAFAGATKAPNRVLLDFEHQRAINGVLGHGAELEERPDALYGRFRVTDHPDGDKALRLVADDVLKGASVTFKPIRTTRAASGVVQRVKVHLDRVSLCRSPAYEQAQVLAVREAPIFPAEVQPVGMSDHLAGLLTAVGYQPLPSRTVVRTAWDSTVDRFTDDEYERSCLIDRGGDTPVKGRCSLPVLEPNGDLNVNALAAAAGRLNQVDAPRDLKAQAARKLVRYYRQAQMDAPTGVMNLAQS